jgi:hypothetical protein
VVSTSRGKEDSHDIKANEHLPHPRPLDSKDLVLRQESLCQSPQHHIVESIDRQRRQKDEKKRRIEGRLVGWLVGGDDPQGKRTGLR